MLVAAALLLQTFLYAQATPPQKEREEGSGKAVEPLVINLSTPTPTLYAGSCVMLEMVLNNKGQEEIRIAERVLWKQFTYGYTARDGSGKGGGQGASCFDCSNEYISLSPGMTYSSSYCLELDNEFFRNVGEYTIATGIYYELAGKAGNYATSNSTRFEIY
jgi:hypothetical protein